MDSLAIQVIAMMPLMFSVLCFFFDGLYGLGEDPCEFVPLGGERAKVGEFSKKKISWNGTYEGRKSGEEGFGEADYLYFRRQCKILPFRSQPSLNENFPCAGQGGQSKDKTIQLGYQVLPSIFVSRVINPESSKFQMDTPLSRTVENSVRHSPNWVHHYREKVCDQAGGNCRTPKKEEAIPVYTEGNSKKISSGNGHKGDKPIERIERAKQQHKPNSAINECKIKRHNTQEWLPKDLAFWATEKPRLNVWRLIVEVAFSVVYCLWFWVSMVVLHDAPFFPLNVNFLLAVAICPAGVAAGLLWYLVVKYWASRIPGWKAVKAVPGKWGYYWSPDEHRGAPVPGYFVYPSPFLYTIGRLLVLYLPVATTVLFWSRGIGFLWCSPESGSSYCWIPALLLSLVCSYALIFLKKLSWSKDSGFWLYLLIPKDRIIVTSSPQ
ncbi:MAG: hypothetical protein QHH75_10225 [Bacillota bacterium]|nr:hypothetical protein [Bacillota bacterium]